MRVQFPVSDKYCEETDWQRHRKTIEIFEEILNKVTQRPSRGCFFKLVELIVFLSNHELGYRSHVHPDGRRAIHGPPLLAISVLGSEQRPRGSSDDTDGTGFLGQLDPSRSWHLPGQETDEQDVEQFGAEILGSLRLPISQRHRDPYRSREVRTRRSLPVQASDEFFQARSL